MGPTEDPRGTTKLKKNDRQPQKIIEKSIDIPQPPISITNELANELYNNNDVKLG